jgi:hypothetical protein
MSQRERATTRSLRITQRIEESIYFVRGEKVMLDRDLAVLYSVETRLLVQAVKRNRGRFPSDFMFQLSAKEFLNLRSQIVISSWGGRRSRPFAFTEQGVAMLSTVLRSKRAVAVNVEIMRVFVRLRRLLSSQQDLARKLTALERRCDEQFKMVFDAIREIMTPQRPPRPRQIGFRPSPPHTSARGRAAVAGRAGQLPAGTAET